MEKHFDDFDKYYTANNQREIAKEAVSLAKSIIDKVEPEWKRDVEYAKIGQKILEIVTKFSFLLWDRADDFYYRMYQHYIDVNKGWRETRKLRQEARDYAIEAANDGLNMQMDSFFAIFERLAPLFFTPNGREAVTTLESTAIKLVK